MTPARLRWGLILISLGVLIILCNTGQLDWDYWIELAEWWPVLLIAIGIEKIFQKSRLQFIAYLSPLLLIGTMAIIAFNYTGDGYQGDSIFEAYKWNWENDSSAERMVVKITHNRFDLSVGPTSAYLASAGFDRLGRRPRIENDIADGIANLDISANGRSRSKIIIGGRDIGNDWRLKLSEQVPLELYCHGNNSDLNLNLQSMKLEKLDINNDDGYISVKVGDLAPNVAIDIEGFDSNLKFRYPKEAGLKVDGSAYSSQLEDLGFTAVDNYYFSPDYETSKIKIDLKIAGRLRHLTFDDY
ncbi:MAG: DUF5668 domain-containing protein [Candidatus Zixiibacteriota bacterium]